MTKLVSFPALFIFDGKVRRLRIFLFLRRFGTLKVRYPKQKKAL